MTRNCILIWCPPSQNAGEYFVYSFKAYDSKSITRMLSCRWLIRHGLRLAAMQVLESPELTDAFENVMDHAMARGKAQAIEELCESKVLGLPVEQVPGYNPSAYDELVAAMGRLRSLELPHIGMIERDQDYPIGVIMEGLTLAIHLDDDAKDEPDYHLKPDPSQLKVPVFAHPRDILAPFALQKEIPLKKSLEAHEQRVAHKKGVKGKVVLCGLGAAHRPRSDGVPVCVATVAQKDAELLTRLSRLAMLLARLAVRG